MFQTLDAIAQALNAGNFHQAELLFLQLRIHVSAGALEFAPQTGYTQLLFADWMHTLQQSINTGDTTSALEAQSAVYEMLDVAVS